MCEKNKTCERGYSRQSRRSLNEPLVSSTMFTLADAESWGCANLEFECTRS